MIRIENWSIVQLGFDPYRPPEAQEQALHGTVYGHPGFGDGEEVTTSSIVSGATCDGRITVRTRSGSEYELGEVSADYEAMFPGARERVAKRFTR